MKARMGLVSGLLLGALAAPVGAQDAPESLKQPDAVAILKNAEGATVGTAGFRQTPNGVLLNVHLEGVPAGTHAFHLHAVGKCEPPFKSAGGHFNPAGREHGFLDEGGPHAGDLPNIHVPDSGELALDVMAADLRLFEGQNALLDDDGAALLIHQGADDYTTDPAGDAGERIACGVVQRH